MNKYLLVLSLEIYREQGKILPCLHTIAADDTLQELRRIIGCDLVTCTEIEVGGKLYDVWSDDEGLMVEKPVPTLYVNDDLVLFGNLVFATNNEGETAGLEQVDVARLLLYLDRQATELDRWFARRSVRSVSSRQAV